MSRPWCVSTPHDVSRLNGLDLERAPAEDRDRCRGSGEWHADARTVRTIAGQLRALDAFLPRDSILTPGRAAATEHDPPRVQEIGDGERGFATVPADG